MIVVANAQMNDLYSILHEKKYIKITYKREGILMLFEIFFINATIIILLTDQMIVPIDRSKGKKKT